MIFFFLLSFLISIVAIPFLISLSNKKKFFDFPEGDKLKIHRSPISFLGGTAMLLAIIVPFLFIGVSNFKFIDLALCCSIIFSVGLWDDIKWKQISSKNPSRKPYDKLFFLILCSLVAAAVLFFAGVKLYLFPILAFFYIFVLINAVNYQDGMDGQAGFLVLISLLGFWVLSIISNNIFSLSILPILIGAIFGFLVYNFPPAKIFMGDSGAYLLGFVLAVFAIIFSKDILSGLFILGLPLFDGVYTNLRRVLRGKSIFLGDREHFFDKMLARGFSVKKTLFISCVSQVVFVAVGILLYIY